MTYQDRTYREAIFSYPIIPDFPQRFKIDVASNNKRLLMRLGGNQVIISYVSYEDALQKARALVDDHYY